MIKIDRMTTTQSNISRIMKIQCLLIAWAASTLSHYHNLNNKNKQIYKSSYVDNANNWINKSIYTNQILSNSNNALGKENKKNKCKSVLVVKNSYLKMI